jgi:hypothetical protein
VPGQPALPEDYRAGVESIAVVSGVLGAGLGVIRSLDERVQALVVLHHYYQLKLDEAAEVLGLDDVVKATELYESAVVAIHQGMLRAAT